MIYESKDGTKAKVHNNVCPFYHFKDLGDGVGYCHCYANNQSCPWYYPEHYESCERWQKSHEEPSVKMRAKPGDFVRQKDWTGHWYKVVEVTPAQLTIVWGKENFVYGYDQKDEKDWEVAPIKVKQDWPNLGEVMNQALVKKREPKSAPEPKWRRISL